MIKKEIKMCFKIVKKKKEEKERERESDSPHVHSMIYTLVNENCK